MRRALRISLLLLGGGLVFAPAQTKFTGFAPATEATPPREVPLVEKPWSALSASKISRNGALALAIDPDKWRHAETDHFILHFRRATEAAKVIRQVEFYLWFVAKTLQCGPERTAGKSHVYIFADTAEWKKFLSESGAPPWSASFAFGEELFLNVRGTDTGQVFDAETLAHETTHAVVARLFPTQRWPLWLNEGFAEYMGEASTAARTGTTLQSRLSTVQLPPMSLTQMTTLEVYPADEMAVGQLYKSAEKLVRFLFVKLPPERFPQFLTAIANGDSLEAALGRVYGDRLKSYAAFERALQNFR